MQLIPSKRTVSRAVGARAVGARGVTGNATMGKGFEFAGIVVVFFGLGWLLDSALGTTPWFMIALTMLGVVGHLVRMWYAYDAEMRQHEAELIAKRDRRVA